MRTQLPTAGLNKALANLRLSLLPTDDLTDRHLLERFLAKRMQAKTIEVDASHLSLITHPQEITDLILDAAARRS